MSQSEQQPDARFRSLLKTKRLKYTPERQRLLGEVLGLRRHFTADGLYTELRERNVPISRDTVFRTLPLLLECGVIQKSVGQSRQEYFECVGRRGHHDHLVCLSCQRVLEFHSEVIERTQNEISEKLGFRLVFHDHRLFGYCQDCNSLSLQ